MPVAENYDFQTMLNELDVGTYFYKFNNETLPSWASELTSFCQIIVYTQSATNWLFDIKQETPNNSAHYRIIYNRSTSSIKAVSKYSLTNISTT